MSKQKFKVAVKEAFAGNSYPEGKPFLADFASDYDRRIFLPMLTDKHWGQLQPEELIFISNEIWYLTNEAFAYFLPAFLIHKFVGDFNTSISIYARLIPPDNLEEFSNFEVLTVLFTLQQRKVIKRFIEHFLDVNINYDRGVEAKRAREYWNKITQ